VTGYRAAMTADLPPPARARRRARPARAAVGVAVAIALLGAAVLAARSVQRTLRDLRPPRVLPRLRAGEGALGGFEEVALRAADGVPLAAWWLPPRNGRAVVLAHGRGANREQLLGQALPLGRRGYGLVLLDLRAHGASGGDRSTSGDRERIDVEAAVAFAAARGVAPGRIAAIGFSIGALAVADAALADERVGAVVLEAMCPSLEDLVSREHGRWGALSARPALWALAAAGVRVAAVNPGDRLCALAPRPVLLVHGARDAEATPAIGERLLRAACGPATLWIVPGAGHGGFDVAAPEELERRLAAFLDAALGAG
jgi:uncharacterized protein